MKRLHPEGIASLIAVILAPSGADYEKEVDRRRTQILELSRAYYSVHPIDFDQTAVYGTQNLAKLNRPNLQHT